MVNQPDDDGSPSPYPQFTTIERNLMIANYNSQEAVVSTRDTGHSASVSGTGRAMRSEHPELARPAKRCLGALAGCFLALDSGFGLVGTAWARR